MTLMLADYQRIADTVIRGVYYPIRELVPDTRFIGSYVGEVVAKERPRKGKGGRMFTPERTRKFEAAVKKWGKAAYDADPIRYPISIDLMVLDETADEFLQTMAAFKLGFDTTKDLDNVSKSILDGLNGVLYKDDKQIVKLSVSRTYHVAPGFTICMERAGLSKAELAQLRKHIK